MACSLVVFLTACFFTFISVLGMKVIQYSTLPEYHLALQSYFRTLALGALSLAIGSLFHAIIKAHEVDFSCILAPFSLISFEFY